MGDDIYSFLCLFMSSTFLIFLVKIFVLDFWWVPTRIENHFMRQGIKSPKYEYFLGNLREISILSLRASAESIPLSHHILPRVLSFLHLWKKLYGIHSFLAARGLFACTCLFSIVFQFACMCGCTVLFVCLRISLLHITYIRVKMKHEIHVHNT